MIHLETDRLILRDYRADDFDEYYRLMSDEQTMYYLPELKQSSVDSAKESFDDVLRDRDSEDRKFYFFLMELKETKETIGNVGYDVVDNTPEGRTVHLGYFSYPKIWGNGYMSEAVKRVLEFAFTEDNVSRVNTGCLTENVGSENVMKKNGMIKEAEYKDHEWHDGKLKTRVEYRLLKDEWESGRISG